MDRVAGVLLAAGMARRFGADKLATDWGGRTLLARSAEAMQRGGLDPVLAVLRPDAGTPVPPGVRPVPNPRWRGGISTSVQTGLAALGDDPDVGAAVLAPADQPWCGAAVYRRLLETLRESGAGIVVATFDGAMRNPVLLDRDHWALAGRIDGDTGLSAVVRGLAPVTVECAGLGSVADIDTPGDLTALRRPGVRTER